MILVSGHSGFIGQAIARRYSTVAIPRLISTFEYRNFFDKNWPDELTVIIHLAAFGNHFFQTNPAQTIEANVLNLSNMLEALRDFPYSKFYNVSSSSVMLDTQTYYSITKRCAEEIGKLYENVVTVRPYSVYGVGEADHRFIPSVIHHLLDGNPMKIDPFAVHDWIYVDDFIDNMLAGETLIGTGRGVQNITIVHLLEAITGKRLTYTEGKLRNYDNKSWVCPQGVKCKVSLIDGLTKVYDSLK